MASHEKLGDIKHQYIHSQKGFKAKQVRVIVTNKNKEKTLN